MFLILFTFKQHNPIAAFGYFWCPSLPKSCTAGRQKYLDEENFQKAELKGINNVIQQTEQP